MPRPDNVGVGVAVFILNENDEILLCLRKGAHRAGVWMCPGGWVERGDQATSWTVAREIYEETGLYVDFVDVGKQLGWTTQDQPELGARDITLYHVVDYHDWSGEVQLREPSKAAEWRWFAISELDKLPLFPGLLRMVEGPLWDRLYGGPGGARKLRERLEARFKIGAHADEDTSG